MNAFIVPVQIERPSKGPAKLTPSEVEELAITDVFAGIPSGVKPLTELDLEDFVRRHIQVVFPQETILVIGQQVRNEERGRADLVALDDSGSVVLIELKRDAASMGARREPAEVQAIRYAANYALIDSPETVVDRLFAPYIERHREEFGKRELSPSQLATEVLDEFLNENNIDESDLNKSQRIVLISSSFDDQTLSACAWLAKGGTPIECITLSPFRYQQQIFLAVEKVIPPPTLADFFVEVADRSRPRAVRPSRKAAAEKATLPRMPKLFEWGIVKPSDPVYVINHRDRPARVLTSSTVEFEGQKLGFNDWGKLVTGWSAINIYEWTALASSGKSLDELRRARLAEEQASDEVASTGISAA